MKKNRNGFTMIELLVVIVMIGVLSVAVGLNMDKILKKTSNNKNKELVMDVYNAALTYFDMYGNCKLKSNCSSSITMNNLITKGLIDEKVSNETNPICNTNKKFSDAKIVISKSGGSKTVSISCDNTENCKINIANLSDLDTYNKNNKWGTC